MEHSSCKSMCNIGRLQLRRTECGRMCAVRRDPALHLRCVWSEPRKVRFASGPHRSRRSVALETWASAGRAVRWRLPRWPLARNAVAGAPRSSVLPPRLLPIRTAAGTQRRLSSFRGFQQSTDRDEANARLSRKRRERGRDRLWPRLDRSPKAVYIQPPTIFPRIENQAAAKADARRVLNGWRPQLLHSRSI